jgi:hypothetical protein
MFPYKVDVSWIYLTHCWISDTVDNDNTAESLRCTDTMSYPTSYNFQKYRL